MTKAGKVLESLRFNGGIPDLDHMSGPRGVGLDSIPDVSTYKDSSQAAKFIKFFQKYDEWKKVADATNSKHNDGNSEIVSSSSGEWYLTEMADSRVKPYAYWDKSKRWGWVNINSDPIKVPAPGK